jgi:NCAIR mutase (PurE)-related protein
VENEDLKRVLEQVRRGKLGVAAALERLRSRPLEALGHTTLDLERAARCGFPEVVYGPGKTTDQILEIIGRLHEAGQPVLVTRIEADVAQQVRAAHPDARVHVKARALTLGPRQADRPARRKQGRRGIVVVTAGTADESVGAEAVLTAELMGQRVTRINDVGVAGLHRLMEHRDTLVAARVIIAIAGMDGVLPTVIAGLTSCPVIGVPTSTGYGTGDQGIAALMTMLNSCAPGVTVVNVDNGFGAGYAAAMINR